MKIRQYPTLPDGTPLRLLVGALTNPFPGVGFRLTSLPIGPDNAPIDAVGLILVDSNGNYVDVTGVGLPLSTFNIAADMASQAEGSTVGGVTNFTFTVSRAGGLSSAATVAWAVSAVSPGLTAADFISSSLPAGILSFAAGDISKQIVVAVAQDSTNESDETFQVTLSSPLMASGADGVIGIGAAQSTITNDDAAGGGGPPTFVAASLTETSSAGTNPPTWDSIMPSLQDGDTVRLFFTTDGNTPTNAVAPNETHIAVATEESITWATWPNAFPDGTVVKWGMDYGRMYGGVMYYAPFSNVLSDTMPVPVNVTGINRGIYTMNLGYGGGPGITNGVTIAGGKKVVLSIIALFNGAQSLTSITANAGAINFTRAAGLAATSFEQVWYANVAAGVTNLDLTFNVSGSTQLITFSVDELTRAAAGGPVAVYGSAFGNGGTDPRTVDGGLSTPVNGLGLFGVYCAHSAITYNGATKEATLGGSGDAAGGYLSMAYQLTAGSVTVNGMTFEGVNLVNSTWST